MSNQFLNARESIWLKAKLSWNMDVLQVLEYYLYYNLSVVFESSYLPYPDLI
ncbi:hypothetical protein [Sphingobacterium sp.]|uniref:hypothetical protein n=1 Tax=Sphingobacterium sp. TaxID=341027 RepID=UPI0028A84E56|nr:hypothetical protein [Sphingobacterium sp.]